MGSVTRTLNNMFSNSEIHVLHVVPGLGPGGMELAMAQIIKGLSTDGMRHSVACLKGEPEIADRLPNGTAIHCFAARPNEPQLPFRLAKLVRKVRPDVIHARNWGAWPDMLLGRLLATWPQIPFVFSFHGLGKAGYMPLRRRVASKIMVHCTTHLFTVSRQSRDLMVAHWGWPRGRTEVIPNGVDTSRFFPTAQPRDGKLVIGSVGNLRTVKNHALILNACARLVHEGLDLEIRIAGEGDQREPLVQLAENLGVLDRLRLSGQITDVPGFLNGLDLFVLSSDSEQHPNALNEAMACGVASIGTRVGCVEDLLDNGRCGRIIEPGDMEGLTLEIRNLVKDETLRQGLAEAGLRHVRDSYSLEVMLNRYKALYLRAAHGMRGRDRNLLNDNEVEI
jgi:glycosyltransferase involved in cell wall biosynthesis